MADQGSIVNLKQNINENIYDNTEYDISGGRMNTVLQNIVDTLNFNGRDFFNVNEYRVKSDAYADAAAGRAAVPDEVKKTGLVIIYLLSDGWHVDTFKGANISDWGIEANWKCVFPIKYSLGFLDSKDLAGRNGDFVTQRFLYSNPIKSGDKIRVECKGNISFAGTGSQEFLLIAVVKAGMYPSDSNYIQRLIHLVGDNSFSDTNFDYTAPEDCYIYVEGRWHDTETLTVSILDSFIAQLNKNTVDISNKVETSEYNEYKTNQGYLGRNNVKAIHSSGYINFNNTTKRVEIPSFLFYTLKAATGRISVSAQEVDYAFSIVTTSAYMLYYDIDDNTVKFVATVNPVTDRLIPLAAINITGTNATGNVTKICWSIFKDARIDNVGESTYLQELLESIILLDKEDVITSFQAIKKGSLWQGVDTASDSCLYAIDYIQVIPNSTIKCFHGEGIKIRITEYDSNKGYLTYKGYDYIDTLKVTSNTHYIRISAEYTGYSSSNPISVDVYQDGDFGFYYPISNEITNLKIKVDAPIYQYYECKHWIDGTTWNLTNHQYGAILIPVIGGQKLIVTANQNVNCRIAFANSYDPANIVPGTTQIDGFGNQVTQTRQTRTFIIPVNCHYIVLNCRYYSNPNIYNSLPVSLIINGKEFIQDLNNTVAYINSIAQDVKDLPVGKGLNIVARNLYKDAAVRGTGTKAVDSDISPLSFIHVSDIHTKSDNYKCFVNCMEYLQYYDKIKFAIVTGDIVWDTFADQMTWYNEALQKTTKPVLNVLGNHDAGQQSSTNPSLSKVGSDLQCYNKYIAPYVSQWGVVQPSNAATDGKSYYYKDFTDEKIRLIVLNEFETDYEIDPNNPNKLLYSREYRAMRQSQVDWLINTLLSTPNDYGVIVSYHQPDMLADETNEFFSFDLAASYRTAHGKPATIAAVYCDDTQWLPKILNAFATKSSLTLTVTQTGAVVTSSPTLVCDCDFSSVQAEFICILNGHTHRDYIGHHKDFPNLTILCVGADNLLYTSTFQPRAEETPSVDLFNVVNVDRNRKTIKIIRVGTNASVTGQIREQLLIEY